jgi:hypothetical protein
MLERDHFIACAKLVDFLDRFSQVLSAQLIGAEGTIEAVVSDMMDTISVLSDETSKYKAHAEEVLEDTYMRPSEETKELLSSVQSSVDDIISAVRDGNLKNSASDTELSTRRLAGRFSKRMESMSTIDDSVGELLLVMTGSLSSGDVIAQRLQHVSRSINALNLGLAYVMVDVHARFNLDGIRKLKEDLLEYTERQYATEQERDIHRSIFANRAI